MSIELYLSNRTESLLSKLHENLVKHWGDPFDAPTLVVPNPNLGKWVKLRLADIDGITANLSGEYLEKVLWKLLCDLYSKETGKKAAFLDPDTLHMLASSTLSEKLLLENKILKKKLLPYLQNDTRKLDSKKKVQISQKLVNLFLEYQYNRPGSFDGLQKGLIDCWPDSAFFAQDEYYSKSQKQAALNEDWQREFYRALFGKNGALEMHNENTGLDHFSLPGLEKKLIELNIKLECQGDFHVFGASGLSLYHRQLIQKLSKFAKFHLYIVNPCSAFWEDTRTPLESWSEISAKGRQNLELDSNQFLEEYMPCGELEENDLLEVWGRPGRENIHLWCSAVDYNFQFLNTAVNGGTSVNILQKTQSLILNRQSECEPGQRQAQDVGIQIWNCPTMLREVETVYSSIIYNMQNDTSLQLTDIAVFIPDPEKYWGTFQQVFERFQRNELGFIPCNFADNKAATSHFSNGVKQLVELINGNFNRRDVMDFLSNPCVSATIGANGKILDQWNSWAEKLNIYHGFDASQRNQQEENAGNYHSWMHGIRRMLVGLVTSDEIPLDSDPESSGSDEIIIPYADFDTGDSNNLEMFIITIESLYRDLDDIAYHRIGKTADQKAQWLINFLNNWFQIPRENAGEKIMQMKIMDLLLNFQSTGRTRQIEWETEEFFETVLSLIPETLPGRSAYLLGGVTVAGLMPMRPVPFKIVYIVGLGDSDFPGRSSESTLDLRTIKRRVGDLATADKNRYLLLETLVSTREKLYLSYTARNIRKDEELQPSSCILELQSFLEQSVLTGDKENEPAVFKQVIIPLVAGDNVLFGELPVDIQEDVDRELYDPPVSYSAIDAWQSELSKIRELSPEPVNPEQFKQDLSKILKDAPGNKNILKTSEVMYPEFATGNREEEVTKHEISTGTLKNYLENPAEFSLKKSMGHTREASEDISLKIDEPFNIEGLVKWGIEIEYL
ncbi:MAG: exodeoxyribonuclease V subunit gamma, partial [Planctomycetes bacterium]|nr:exodeoxyribonuclease V subunit gamma [Planctomycetota bacterium]